MLVLLINISDKVRFEVEDALQIKGLQVQKFTWIDLSKLRAENDRQRIQGLEFSFNFNQLAFLHQVSLVEKDLVCEHNLFYRFILDSFRLLLMETIQNVQCVYNCNDTVELVHFLNVFVYKKGLHNRSWISKTSCFDNNAVKHVYFLVEFLESNDKIATNCAAYTSVHHLDYLFVHILRYHLIINSNFAKFVFYNRKFHPMSFVIENMVQQGGFTRS
mmetsp:Transcript_24267/g.34777  ORF Transcript_24267/g.34777 Transcript_24267/m.34777 type:complete len:217 (-) Transcript_24267:187-837(-)